MSSSSQLPRPRVPWRIIWATIGSVLLTLLVLTMLSHLHRVLVWLVVAAFLAMVLNPAVDLLERRFSMRRALATLIVFVVGLLVVAGLVTLFVRPLISEGQKFADDLPGYVADAREGRGPIGNLVERYDLEERVQNSSGQIREYLSELGSRTVQIAGAIGTAVAGLLTILVMTLLMLLEGPRLLQGFVSVLPPGRRDRVRIVAADCSRAITGYMAGNLLISVIAGTLTFILLLVLDVPFAAVLALFVAIMDLIPLVGATVAAIVVSLTAFGHSPTAGIVALIFFIVYQQLENHVLQPIVQGKTVQLSPLVVLVAVITGVELAGILGALLAIPVAGVIQVIARDLWEHRSGAPKREPTIGVDEVPVSEAADATTATS